MQALLSVTDDDGDPVTPGELEAGQQHPPGLPPSPPGRNPGADHRHQPEHRGCRGNRQPERCAGGHRSAALDQKERRDHSGPRHRLRQAIERGPEQQGRAEHQEHGGAAEHPRRHPDQL